MITHFYTASSLDGFIATPEHSLDWLLKQDFDLQGPMAYPDFITRMGALAMGASTYEWILRQQESWEYTQPAWVFTHRDLPVIDGADLRFARGPVADVFGDIADAAGDKDIWVVGGGDLAGQFADAGLLDEVWVQFAPVTLGSGRPLLPRALDLELLEVARNRDFVCAHHRVLKDR
ncbi:MAG: dihydrofolate reductase family protein [Acidipropionibacterium acidipropionici]|jgi:dihydrofolate reductase|uniref:Deaminase n=2 Tax=Acidipropionibacterium acidipropionici TaxID=1748 RepID=A0A142KEH9_9ACTN|nr:dihydrofolate reductase family protein [Acidipropionibacterium acidipropionici]AFV89533.1 Bifunctional deaminase-reductase domain-containing protein [Acidipropionibacterium acidipropionici ATCC 4875]ALN16013.1 deaminase [Acidipropionibacterium acidipropionici]AMS04517.1 deaminase [Acidipropionibacterium acidipropionici]AOZ46010.1 deaminase [Acidipropionibacterium acidipropionici]APZ08237.1 deaminase [Acidipropionibacterium acidipropionici]